MATNNNIINERITAFEKRVNDALKATREAMSNLNQYARAKKNLTNEVVSLNATLKQKAYAELMATSDPIKSFCLANSYNARKVVEVVDKSTGSITDIKVDIQASKMDISEFVKVNGLDDKFIGLCNQLLARLQIRACDVFALSDKELLMESGLFIKMANATKDGETPGSNTQLTKNLKAIYDTLNINASVTMHDIYFIEQCAHKFDTKAAYGIKSMSSRQFLDVMTRVFRKAYENGQYSVTNVVLKDVVINDNNEPKNEEPTKTPKAQTAKKTTKKATKEVKEVEAA